jgi:7-cyano-7-deazaguanine reductase
MNSIIEEIASKHLGKAGDGSVVKPYVTPESIDPTLLVGIPRHLNRTQYNIENGSAASIGMDVWNAYEVSFLLKNGFPVSCYVRIVYDSTSENIVESKSIKLYLNSFNMNRFDCATADEALSMVKRKIQDDLTPVLGVTPFVGVMEAHCAHTVAVVPEYPVIETLFDYTNYSFDAVNENPELLVADNTQTSMSIRTSLLRSNCRVTSQPDWGDVYIKMVGDSVPSVPSLAQYIVSMRKENHFHEEICECIYKRLVDKFKPSELFVACLYTRRGGIDINPVRYSSVEFFNQEFPNFLNTDVIYKTTRQ